jgi:hypothetical protein
MYQSILHIIMASRVCRAPSLDLHRTMSAAITSTFWFPKVLESNFAFVATSYMSKKFMLLQVQFLFCNLLPHSAQACFNKNHAGIEVCPSFHMPQAPGHVQNWGFLISRILPYIGHTCLFLEWDELPSQQRLCVRTGRVLALLIVMDLDPISGFDGSLIGQFGTRLMGGKDAASARYIFTRLEKITRTIFHEADDKLLNYLAEEGQSIEPSWYFHALCIPQSKFITCLSSQETLTETMRVCVCLLQLPSLGGGGGGGSCRFSVYCTHVCTCACVCECVGEGRIGRGGGNPAAAISVLPCPARKQWGHSMGYWALPSW